MGQRGRKSSASLSVVNPVHSDLPPAPEHYGDEAADLWCRIVAEKPADWWDSATLPMLDEFVTVTLEMQQIVELVKGMHPISSDEEVSAYERLHKIWDRLSSQRKRVAAMLRLSNQSRYNAKNAGTAAKGGASKLWQKG